MKKIFQIVAVALMALAPLGALAQGMPTVPVDSAVRVGKLDNGLTYYIRHNEKPKGQADFFIAQKVGSILEEDNQRGLAHFLEHMCFNGTKNFPGNSLIDWLETVGVKFGKNLNAYTSIDETVYNISAVPVQRTGVQDSCLLILHDWANDLLLDPEEIEKERGVIHQEWRRSNVGEMRLYEKLLPVIYPNNKYGLRLPIGTMEVVDNFPPKAIRDYYETWYRPDQQGVIVVGDIDPDYIEAKIKEIFADIEMPANAKERVYLDVADNDGTIYAIGTDPEVSAPTAMIMAKLKNQLMTREERGTAKFFGINYLQTVISSMINERLADMSKNADCPFASARVELDNFFLSPTKDALTLQVTPKGNNMPEAIEASYREVLRALRGGFQPGEYKRASDKYVSSIDQQYEQRAGRENTSYAREYARNFTQGDPIPGIEFEHMVAQMLPMQIPVDAVSQAFQALVQVGDDNRVVMVMMPDKEGYTVPTEQQLAAALAKVDGEDIAPFQEADDKGPLVTEEPAPVEAKVSENAQWQATELVYPNGAKVLIKPTKFKDGEIFFTAIAKGGFSAMQVSPETLIALPLMTNVGGLGTFNQSDMKKYLAGKQTNVIAQIDDYTRSITGTTTPKNLQTLMELIYMNFKAFNITEEDFAAAQARYTAVLSNQESTPQFQAQAGWMKNLYKSPARRLYTSEAINKASREETVEIMQQALANPGDYTFAFVGDINLDTFIPLCNKYIGSIAAPRIAGIPYVVNPDMEPTTGPALVQDEMKMETPQTWAFITLTGDVPFTAKNAYLSSIASQILSKRLLNKIREEMGAVYSIGAQGQFERTGNQNAALIIPFPMKPEVKDEVLAEIQSMLEGMSKEIKQDELAPVLEFMVKEANDNAEKNNAWAGAITNATLNGVDAFNNRIEVLNSITTQDVQNYIANLMQQNNYRTYLLNPKQ